jgi:PEP-CTERM motif
MKFHARLPFSVAFVLLCSIATPVAADPITATYAVLVTGRMTAESNPVFLPFDQEFILRMTFDPALASGQGYGPVRFSAIPLPSVAPPDGLHLTTNSFTLHGQFSDDEFDPLNLFATATITESNFTGPEWIYFRNTRLITNVPTTDPPPPFTAETFPAHLVLGSPVNFNYGTTLFDLTPTLRLVDDMQYQGFARLLDVEPVSEPTTAALVGGGLLLLAWRRKRRHVTRTD